MGKKSTNADAQTQTINRAIEGRPTFQEIERLVDKFKFERIFYLSLIGACSIILMSVSIISFLKNDWKTGLAILAPGGAISFCFSKVFKIWDDIMKAFFNLQTDRK